MIFSFLSKAKPAEKKDPTVFSNALRKCEECGSIAEIHWQKCPYCKNYHEEHWTDVGGNEARLLLDAEDKLG